MLANISATELAITKYVNLCGLWWGFINIWDMQQPYVSTNRLFGSMDAANILATELSITKHVNLSCIWRSFMKYIEWTCVKKNQHWFRSCSCTAMLVLHQTLDRNSQHCKFLSFLVLAWKSSIINCDCTSTQMRTPDEDCRQAEEPKQLADEASRFHLGRQRQCYVA